MKSNLWKFSFLTATLGLALATGAYAQQTDTSTPAAAGQNSPPANSVNAGRNADQNAAAKRSIETREQYMREHQVGVAPANKASNLIGMEVRNPQHVKLGAIKDLVVDLPSGKIAYVVLGTGGFLGLGEKLVPIPPSAFTESSAENALVLNADKAKIEGAPTIPSNNWPDVHSQIWGANKSYWKNAGANAANETRTAVENAANQAGIETRAHFEAANARSFSGRITEVNAETGMVTVEHGNQTKTFKIGGQTMVTVDQTLGGHLSDLKVGDHVRVNYEKKADGAFEVTSIAKSHGLFNK